MVLFFVFRTSKWVIINENCFKKAKQNKQPILLCNWHARFLSAVYYLKLQKSSNIWAISSTHQDSEAMAYFLKRSNFNLIRGSSTRGWDNVIKKMIRLFKNYNNIIAITNDGPKGPPRIAKVGSYKIAKRYGAQIITISCASNKYWQLKSWDSLQIPKPFSTIYVKFSDPLNYSEDKEDNADLLTNFINMNLNNLDKYIKNK